MDANASSGTRGQDRARLRLLTCGSVDDGKSTLIGRLIHDLGGVSEDQLAALERDSRRFGTTGGDIDFALLLDGLEAEREQGITIDVAYRYFSSPSRAFTVVDAPGHEQYTRNMATGASNADAALLLIDARKGLLPQTRRHCCIVSLLGIRHVVVVVNKMDLVGFSREVFERIVADVDAFAAPLHFQTRHAIPISARQGDNVAKLSPRTGWYAGPTLLGQLEAIDAESNLAAQPLRMPVQWVNRPNQDFRGFSGTLAAGTLHPSDEIVVARSGRSAKVARIVTADGDLDEATAGQAITITLDAEIDASRGDVFAGTRDRPEVANQFAAHVIWFAEDAMLPGRQYLLKAATRTTLASVTDLKHVIDVTDLGRVPAKSLAQNEIGLCNFATAEAITFDPYTANRTTGSFILVDRFTNATVGAGMMQFALRRASNVQMQHLEVDKTVRASLKGQKPAVLWFTGLSGAGKSTIANIVEQRLAASGRHTYMLDGDNLRHGLNRDLGFLPADRVENVRRVGEVAKLMVDAGLIVLVSLISPFRSERQMVRELLAPGEFTEIHVAASLETCRKRDPKGLYKKADAGQIANFTGVSSPYEAPLSPEIVLQSDTATPEELAEQVLAYLDGKS